MARAVDVLLLALGLCVSGGASSVLEDDSALVQAGVRSHQQQRAASTVGLASRMELVEKLATGGLPDFLAKLQDQAKFNCTLYPQLCQAPFNCQDLSPLDLAKIPMEGMAAGGKPNLGIWCQVPMYAPYVSACLVDKDLVKAGRIQYDWTVGMGAGIDEADGSYCFIEGHCSNEAVTNETTLEEANQMCDDRYGRDGWSKLGSIQRLPQLMKSVSPFLMKDMTQAMVSGFHDTRLTTLFLKSACAMGNYHCDVVYCKETYCKNPYYLKKYHHLLPKAPGHLLQNKDWLE